MEFLIWSIIICLFVISFIGIFIPVIPAVLLLWLGFFVYHFFLDGETLAMSFWVAMVVLTIILMVSDFLMSHYFVNKFGGTKWSQFGAVIGVIIGIFVYPPFGMIVVPFLLVFVIEMIEKRSVKIAGLAAIGAIVGFLSSAVAKIFIQLVMVFWFIAVALLEPIVF